ncbi:MAG TPA: malonate decarboxylase subunit alpha [Candidatus Nanoarchaeia archaeon]|nr:malonate decarboxylase subunit alpha [Candidatus Nanoarchaeia archaeon]
MEFTTLAKAIEKIKDGSFITFSGMELNRAPMALIFEIARQKKKNLKIISIPNPLAADVLIKNNCVREAIFGFNGFSYEDGFVIAPNWRKAIENGLIKWKETDILEIIQALKAAALGLNEIEVSSFKNTNYLKFNEYKKSGGSIMTNALNPDFALIHAQYADRKGNVFINDPLIDKLIAKASKKVIVSVEKIADKLEEITIPAEKIDFIVEIKNGALPTSCFKFYNYDAKKIREYLSNGKNNGNEKPAKNEIEKKQTDYIITTLADFIIDNKSVATGVASPLPMLATMFARKLGKKFNYFNCGSGAINPDIKSPAYSSVTVNALERKDSFIELDKVWDFALKGDIDLMFFGAVQISKKGEANITCIGDYKKPKVKLPGPAGAVTLRNLCKRTIITTQNHSKRTFVDKVDFITTSSDNDTIVISNLGILKLGKKPEILGYYPVSSIWEIKDNTGFDLEDVNAKKLSELTDKDIKILNEIDPEGIRYRIR